MAVIQPVEVADAGSHVGSVIAERRLLLGLWIAVLEKVFPVVETSEGVLVRRFLGSFRHAWDLLHSFRGPSWLDHVGFCGAASIRIIGLNAPSSLRHNAIILTED